MEAVIDRFYLVQNFTWCINDCIKPVHVLSWEAFIMLWGSPTAVNEGHRVFYWGGLGLGA